MMPPMFLIFKVRGFSIWLPLFLLWALLLILLLPLILLLLPVALLAACFKEGRQWLALAGQIWVIFCSLRGTKINVKSGQERVYLQLF